MIFEAPGLIAPNEELHCEYVAFMRATGRLPDPTASQRNDESRQPPVYDALGALLSLPFQQIPQDGDFVSNSFYIATHRGNLNVRLDINPETAPALYAMRIASLLFGIAGVIAVYACARLTLSPSASLIAIL